MSQPSDITPIIPGSPPLPQPEDREDFRVDTVVQKGGHLVTPADEVSIPALPEDLQVEAMEKVDFIKLVGQEVEELSKELRRRKSLYNEIEQLASQDIPCLQEAVSKDLERVKIILQKGKVKIEKIQAVDYLVNLLEKSFSWLKTAISKPIFGIAYDLNVIGDDAFESGKKLADNIIDASLGLNVIIQSYGGAMLIARAIIYKIVENDYRELKKDLGLAKSREIAERLKALEIFLESTKHSLKEEAIAYAMRMGSAIPFSLSDVLNNTNLLSALFPATLFSTASVCGLALAGLSLSKTVKNQKIYKEWAAEQVQGPFLSHLGEIKRGAEEPKAWQKNPMHKEGWQENPVHKDPLKELNGLLKKRENIRSQRLADNESAVEDLIEQLDNDVKDWKKIESGLKGLDRTASKLSEKEYINTVLKKQGIYLSRAEKSIHPSSKDAFENYGKEFERKSTIETMEDLKNYFETTPDFKNNLIEQYTDHQETISLSTRNALKALAKEKIDSERKFFNFKFAQNSLLYGLTVVSSLSMIVLKITAAATLIALPIAAMIAPMVVVPVATTLMLAAGLFLFYKHKPNLFKTTFKLTKLQLSLSKVPLWFNNFRLRTKKIAQESNNTALELISARNQEFMGLAAKKSIDEKLLPSELKPLLKKLKKAASDELDEKGVQAIFLKENEKLQSQKQKLEKKIKKLEKKAAYWNERYQALIDKVNQAASQDFAQSARMATQLIKEEVAPGKFETKEFDVNIYDILVEGLLEGKWLMDAETDAILRTKMGINLSKIPNDQRKEIRNALLDFFVMNDSAMLNFIKNQRVPNQ